MKQGYIIVTICVIFLSSSTAWGKNIIHDINTILQVEDSVEKKKEVEKTVKKEAGGRKQIISRYSENNLPRTRNFVDAFKVAVEVIFGETKEDTAIDTIRNSAYMLKGTSAFIIKGLDYCMQKDYLGAKGKEAKENYLEKNHVTLTNVDLIFSKTKPLTAKEQEVLQAFTEKAVEQSFTSIDACVRHEYQVSKGVFTLSTYDKTSGYVDTMNAFLRSE